MRRHTQDRVMHRRWPWWLALCLSLSFGLGAHALEPDHAETAVPADVGDVFPVEPVNQFLGSRSAAEGKWGVSVIDLSTRQVIYRHNDAEAMQPASTAKLMSTAFALDVLGADARFRTQVLSKTLPDAVGVLPEPLLLVGGGDPNLSSRVFPYRGETERGPLTQPFDDIAMQVYQQGVREIPDGIIADDRRYPQEPPPAGWTAEDRMYWYGAPVGSLIFNDGMVTVSARAGGSAGQSARVSLAPNPDGLIRYHVDTVRRGGRDFALYLADRGQDWQLRGAIRMGGGSSAMLAQPDPARMAAQALRDALERRGIAVGKRIQILRRALDEPRPDPQNYAAYVTLAEMQSPPLRDAVTVVNKVSQNLHAEMLLREASLRLGGDGSLEQATNHLRSWLYERNLVDESAVIDDASGLSRRDRMSPFRLASLLGYASQTAWASDWRASLPVAGRDGTLRYRLHDVQERIQAKTGTLKDVAALAGYVQRDNGKEYAFAVMVNRFSVSESQIKGRIDQLLRLIALNPVSAGPARTAMR